MMSGMGDEGTSLNADLTSAVRTVVDSEGAESAVQRLSALEEEHRVLCDRRRRLHESIDIMASAATVRPDAAPLLERYRTSEREISWRRQVLYREIGALRSEHSAAAHEHGDSAATQSP
jgi:hypothetical protein